MKITDRQQNGVAVLDLAGKITIGMGDVQLREAVRDQLANGRQNLLLNLADVTTIDSSGIGELVSSYAATTNRGGKLKLVNLQPKIDDLLTITQLRTIFDIYDEETEALASY